MMQVKEVLPHSILVEELGPQDRYGNRLRLELHVPPEELAPGDYVFLQVRKATEEELQQRGIKTE